MRRFFAWGCVLAALALQTPCFALEWVPEFVNMSETEQGAFEGPSRLGSEYQSDVLAYTKPDYWEYLWLSNEDITDVSLGSVSSVHFIVNNRLKLSKFLSDSIEFRFTFVDERTRERESIHHVFEFVFWWPWKKLGLSLYGDPSLYKREDDTGIALLFKPTERHEIRLFNTFVDVTRQRRNDRSDTFVEPYFPYARGIVGRAWSDPKDPQWEFVEYAFRHETETVWNFPEENYQYRFWRLFASLYFKVNLFEDFAISTRFQADRKFESRSPTSLASTVQNEAWTTDRAFLILRGIIYGLGPSGNWQLTPGVEYAYRSWDTTFGVTTYRDLLPHVWLTVPAFGKGATRDHVSLGYEFTWHRVSGPPSQREAIDDVDGLVEQRLNLSYDVAFRDNAIIRLMATADLDKFGTASSWEGGNIQVTVNF